MTKPKTIGPELTELALLILERVKNAPFEDQLDAFKALTAFHVGATRVSKNLPEEPDEGSIVSLRDRIAHASIGKVSKRPRDPDAPRRDPARHRVYRALQQAGTTNDLDKLTEPGEMPF